jgi:endonuclease/exonuclease/phosphatase family metal-dependent hydrolase
MTGGLVHVGPLRVATWNIHNARGADGRRDLGRIAAVIEQLGADLIGLQEVGCAGADGSDVDELAKRNGYTWHAVPTCGRGVDGARGNALLTTLPVEAVTVHDLSVPRREPRAALETVVRWKTHRLRLVVTHLGLHAGERRFQVERLISSLGTAPVAATILLGDINEWFLWGRPLRWLHRRFGTSPSVRTFPSRAPVFALDRIWAEPRGTVVSIATFSAPGLRGASDHLPVVASLRLPDASQDLGQSPSQAGPLIASSG